MKKQAPKILFGLNSSLFRNSSTTLATSDENNSGSGLNVAEAAIYHNGSYYLVTSDQFTWEEAQAQAKSVGGNFVTINDAAEETWLESTFGTADWFWLGINDIAVEGQFEWASGEAVTYTNWAPGQPDDYQGNQDAGLVRFGNGRHWNDGKQLNQYLGIIEISGIGVDNLVGGVGNNLLVGGLGNDILEGSDAVAVGNAEKNTMLGGAGADIFVLGNAAQAYYQSQGDQDYALIKDFSSAEGDRLQLHGNISSYTQQQQGSDLYLYRQGTTSDLVAIFENTTTLALNAVAVNNV
ncbi:MAG: lectin-like protein [Cyanobacteria bacterium P01_D01_bin.105]